jgi:hypothetical protein
VQFVDSASGGPALAVFCDSPEAERSVRASLGASCAIRCCNRWSDVELEAAAVDCVVAVVASLNDDVAKGRLEAIRTHAPNTPIVVVATRDLESAGKASTGPAYAVVRVTAIPEQLFPAVVRVLKHSYLEAVAGNALHAGSLSRDVRIAIAAACRSHAPVNSVERLAKECGLPRSTLSDAWRRSVPTTITSKAFLRWIRLLRAVARKTPQRSWESIAAEFEVDADTLWRDATQVAGFRLHDLSLGTIDVLRERFRDTVLHPLGIASPPAKMR